MSDPMDFAYRLILDQSDKVTAITEEMRRRTSRWRGYHLHGKTYQTKTNNLDSLK